MGNLWGFYVVKTAQFCRANKESYEKAIEELQGKHLVEEFGVEVNDTAGESARGSHCDEDQNRFGGCCDGEKVSHPERFQSMDEHRDNHGLSDVLLFFPDNRLLGYAYPLDKHNQRRSLWWPPLLEDPKDSPDSSKLQKGIGEEKDASV